MSLELARALHQRTAPHIGWRENRRPAITLLSLFFRRRFPWVHNLGHGIDCPHEALQHNRFLPVTVLRNACLASTMRLNPAENSESPDYSRDTVRRFTTVPCPNDSTLFLFNARPLVWSLWSPRQAGDRTVARPAPSDAARPLPWFESHPHRQLRTATRLPDRADVGKPTCFQRAPSSAPRQFSQTVLAYWVEAKRGCRR